MNIRFSFIYAGLAALFISSPTMVLAKTVDSGSKTQLNSDADSTASTAVAASGTIASSNAMPAAKVTSAKVAKEQGGKSAKKESIAKDSAAKDGVAPVAVVTPAAASAVVAVANSAAASSNASQSASASATASNAGSSSTVNTVSSGVQNVLSMIGGVFKGDSSQKDADNKAEISTDKSSSKLQRYSNVVQDVILNGLELIGTAYRYGGTTTNGLDCSGFVQMVFNNAAGLLLPRTALGMSGQGVAVSKDDLKPGDLVFFNTMRRTFSHVGIYMGDNTFMHAPRTGAHVRIEDMSNQYWMARYNGARRIIDMVQGKK